MVPWKASKNKPLPRLSKKKGEDAHKQNREWEQENKYRYNRGYKNKKYYEYISKKFSASGLIVHRCYRKSTWHNSTHTYDQDFQKIRNRIYLTS